MIADGEATPPDGDAVVLRLVQPAERAQAEFFADVLRQEIATMTAKVAKAEADWRRRCDEKGYVEPPCRIGGGAATCRGGNADARRDRRALSAYTVNGNRPGRRGVARHYEQTFRRDRARRVPGGQACRSAVRGVGRCTAARQRPDLVRLHPPGGSHPDQHGGRPRARPGSSPGRAR